MKEENQSRNDRSPIIQPTEPTTQLSDTERDRTSRGDQSDGNVVINMPPERGQSVYESDNKFQIARSKVQRSLDIPLLVSNMSQLIIVIRASLTTAEFVSLIIILTLAIVIHIAVGTILFGLDGKELNDNKVTKLEYFAFFGVSLVTILNLLAATLIVAFLDFPVTGVNPE